MTNLQFQFLSKQEQVLFTCGKSFGTMGISQIVMEESIKDPERRNPLANVETKYIILIKSVFKKYRSANQTKKPMMQLTIRSKLKSRSQ